MAARRGVWVDKGMVPNSTVNMIASTALHWKISKNVETHLSNWG